MPLVQELKKLGLGPEYDAIHAEFRDTDTSEATIIKLERRMIDSHMACLLQNGKSLMMQRKHLLYCWHPEKKDQIPPSMTFINNRLGDDHCYKLIDICVDRIKNPASPEPAIPAANAASPDLRTQQADIIKQMAHKAAYAPTYFERFFYKSLIGAMKDAGSYANLLQELNKSPAKVMATIMPITGTLCCTAFFASTLVFGMSLVSAVSRVSGKVEKSSNEKNQQIAGKVKNASDQAYYLIVSLPAILASMNITLASNTLSGITNAMHYIANDETVPPVNTQSAIESIVLQIIVSHISNYIEQQSRQRCAHYREGASKSIILKSLVNEIEMISKKTSTLAEKLDEVEKLLTSTAVEPMIMNSGKDASAALACAKMELEQARKILTNADELQFYNAFHGAMLPLQQYLNVGQQPWPLLWGDNVGNNLIKKAVTTLSESTNLQQIKATLDLLHTDAERIHADKPAMQAIEKAQAVLAEQCKAAPRP